MKDKELITVDAIVVKEEKEKDKNLPTSSVDLSSIIQKEQNDSKTEYEEIEEEEIEKPRKTTLLPVIVAIIVILIALCLIFFGFNKASNYISGDKGFESKSAQEVIEKQENPAWKSDVLDNDKAFIVKNASDTLNNLTISIEKIQFRRDCTRIWVKFKNSGPNRVEMMPNANSILIDNNGIQYKSDPFAGQQTLSTGIAPGTTQEQMLVFDPIQASAKKLTFNINMLFDMKNSSWQTNIKFNIP